MTKSQEEFYNFVVAPDNFDAVCDIVESFEDVRLRLIYDFWVGVKDECDRFLIEDPKWTVSISPYEDFETDLSFYRQEIAPKSNNELPDFCISIMDLYDRAFCGLWLDEEAKMFDMKSLKSIAKNNKIAGWATGSPTCAYYKYVPDNFKLFQTLRKISPENKLPVTQQYTRFILDAIKEMEPFINEHILKTK